MRTIFASLCFVLLASAAHAQSSGKEFLSGWRQQGTLTIEHRGKRYTGRVTMTVTSNHLVAKARAYLGTNPTGWARVWCGRFMAMIAPAAAARVGNPNLARNWAKLPRVAPQVGAIAVMHRRGGGHVGVVSGFDAKGNPIIVSGNHNRRVAEAVYPRGRIYAWVRP